MNYEYATNAHLNTPEGGWYNPMCGSARASSNPLDDEPIVADEAAFLAIPAEYRCMWCESYLDN